MKPVRQGHDSLPRRSVLFLPGTKVRALEKARTLAADVLVFDLEDSVAPHRKVDARVLVCDALNQGGYAPRECVVRVNRPTGNLCDEDLAAIAGIPVSAVLFPKIDDAGEVLDAVARMERAGIHGDVALWIMAESPMAILNIGSIARASRRLDCIVVGTSDLCKEMRVPPTPGRLGVLSALSMCVMAARSVGVDVLDGVHVDLTDARGFARVCEQGRYLGFDGKTLIHPDQIDEANRVFSPQASDVERARKIIDAWDDALERGDGVAVVDGSLVENLHVEEASRVLALNAVIQART